MSTDPKSALDPFCLRSLADDPFCQRSSPEIARDVHDAAMWTLSEFMDLRDVLVYQFGGSDSCIQDVVGYHGDLRRAVEELGHHLECVSGW
jgi:hypothetical protein